MCKMSKQIPTILFIKSFHPPDFSLVLRPPFEVHQTCRWCVCLSVSVRVCQRERLGVDFPHAAQPAHLPVIPTQHSNASEARSTSEEALGLSTGGKVNRCSHLPAHLDGIRATGHSEGAAHHAHTTHKFWLCLSHHSPQRLSVHHMEGFKSPHNQWV